MFDNRAKSLAHSFVNRRNVKREACIVMVVYWYVRRGGRGCCVVRVMPLSGMYDLCTHVIKCKHVDMGNISKTRFFLAAWMLLESWKGPLQELPGAPGSLQEARPRHQVPA